jgi:lambda family phage tail tape measure protein
MMSERKAQLKIGADASGVEAGIGKAKKAINSLGATVADSNSKASKSIDKYVKTLQDQQRMMGKSSREIELYKLAMKGASDQQLKAADSAIKMRESMERSERISSRIRGGFIAFGAAAVAAAGAAYLAFDRLIKQVADFQTMAEKIGDSASSIASFATAAAVSGVSMDSITAASVKLTKGLQGVDDETKEAGAAIKALGLNLADFKRLSPTDQIEAVARALDGFEDGASKTAVAMALFGKSGADLIPFLKDLAGNVGRVNYLTEEQIALSDKYTKQQARLKAEIQGQAQVFAVNLLPAYNELLSIIADLAKNQDIARAASALLSAALSTGLVVFKGLSIVALESSFIIKGTGRNISALAQQIAALARLDIRGFFAISEAVGEDTKRARAEIDRLRASILSIGNTAPKFQDPRILGPVGTIAEQAAAWGQPKKRLNFSGAPPKPKPTKPESDNSAEQEARARLAADLDLIRRESERTLNTYSNAQRIMEAQRSAGLISESEYYAAKLRFLQQNSQEQERALQAEISRLQQEQLKGKDKIDNERQIAAAESRLFIIRANALTQERVLEIQAADAVKRHAEELKRQAAAMLSARQAAQDYYAAINLQQSRELEGIGRGNRARNLASGLNQIDDRYSEQRRDLENQRAQLELEGKFTADQRAQYEQRLAIINEFQQKSRDSYIAYFADITAKQRDWALGANEALQNYYDESLNIFEGVENVITNAFNGMEDALANFVRTGKLDFKGLADSIIADITRIIIKQQLLGPLAKSLQSGSGSDALSGFFGSLFGGGRASGGPVKAGRLYEVNERGPELLNVAGRQYLMMGDKGGSVTPNASSGQRVALTQNIYVQGGASDRRTHDQVASSAFSGAQRALARVG